MTVERIEPPLVAQEREMLDAWLDFHRATLAVKCEGLADDQLRERAVPPSSLSLLGLVRHMGEVERSWFRRVLGGEQAPPRYYSDENRDGDFDDVADADVGEAFGYWRGERFSLRWIMVHMIEEYARHNGHADLLRERIDGTVGD